MESDRHAVYVIQIYSHLQIHLLFIIHLLLLLFSISTRIFCLFFFYSSCYIMKQFAVCVLWIVHNPSVEVWIIEEINVHRSLACVYESLLHKGSAFINDLLEGLTTKWNITAGSAHAQQPTLNQLAVSEPQGEQQTKVLFRSIHTGRNNASSYTKWTPCLYRVVLIERKQH